MAGAAVIATQLTDQSSVAYRLTLDGVDFLERGGAFGVPIESIRVGEEGPGGVSSMSFTINDPLIEAVFTTSATVEFWDVANDRPLFLGFIQSVAVSPTAVGRTFAVTCIGIEALLDWMLVPYLQVFTGTVLPSAIQAIVANATGVGHPIRALAADGYGTQAGPITNFETFPTTTYEVVIEGQSVREAIRLVAEAAGTWYRTNAVPQYTIDFYSGLRFGSATTDNGQWYGLLGGDLSDIPMGEPAGIYPSSLRIDLRPTDVVRAVYIKGGIARTTGYDPVGSGLVADGSGIPGPVAYISDDTSTTDAIRDYIGASYLVTFSMEARGSMTFDQLDTFFDTYDVRPGMSVSFDPDSQLFAEATSFVLFAITKTFHVNGQSWDVSFGGFKPTTTYQSRRLTRTTRS